MIPFETIQQKAHDLSVLYESFAKEVMEAENISELNAKESERLAELRDELQKKENTLKGDRREFEKERTETQNMYRTLLSLQSKIAQQEEKLSDEKRLFAIEKAETIKTNEDIADKLEEKKKELDEREKGQEEIRLLEAKMKREVAIDRERKLRLDVREKELESMRERLRKKLQ